MHLKSLHIKNFRMLEDFQVSKLGRVNLIVGKNNSGKSSVLEALRIYAGNANPNLLAELAQSHDEKWQRDNEEPEAQDVLPFKAFFSGRKFPDSDASGIEVGDGTIKNSVKIEHGFYLEELIIETDPDGEERPRVRRTRVSKNDLVGFSGEAVDEAIFIQVHDGNSIMLRFDGTRGRVRAPLMAQKLKPCAYIPTQFISKDELADEWDKIGLTEAQELVKNALRIISPDFEDILFVRNDELNELYPRLLTGSSSRSLSRSAIVKLKDEDEPVPLNSMGDGISRVLQLFLKLFAARGGFLLIDEFENGLHYSVQKQVWQLVFDLAKKLDVQVFATTHSWDCIESFAKVAVEKTDTEGVLFRIGRSVRATNQGKVIATVFDEDKLLNITQSDIEVR